MRDAAVVEVVGGAAEDVGAAAVLVLAEEREVVLAGEDASGFGVVLDGIALKGDVDEVMSGGEEETGLRVRTRRNDTMPRRRRMAERERSRKAKRKGKACMTARTRKEERDAATIMLRVTREERNCLVMKRRSWRGLGAGLREA